MIVIPKKKCDSVNCNNLIDFRNKYCDEHKYLNNQYDKQRYISDYEVRRTYNTTIWKHTRRSVLMRDDYMCLYCLHKGLYTQATAVDHFIPVRDDISKRFDMDNLVSCCIKCNNEKAKDEYSYRNYMLSKDEYYSKWKH